MSVEYRKMIASDISEVIGIQNESLLGRVAEEQLQDGFVQGEFTAADFEQFNEDVAVVVACNQNQNVIGYLCASHVELHSGKPLINFITERMKTITLDGKLVSTFNCVMTGPICIAKSERGKGIFEGLYNSFFTGIGKNFELCVAFVDAANPRSLAAHEKKLSMNIIDNFEFNGRIYNLIARKI